MGIITDVVIFLLQVKSLYYESVGGAFSSFICKHILTSDELVVEESRKVKALRTLALRVACYLHWDLSTMEKRFVKFAVHLSVLVVVVFFKKYFSNCITPLFSLLSFSTKNFTFFH